MDIEKTLNGSRDFLLTYILSHYGMVTAVAVVGSISFLFGRMLSIILKQENKLAISIGTGCIAVLSLQLVIYIMGNTGILMISSYCPFISYDQTGILVSYILIGILLSIYRYI